MEDEAQPDDNYHDYLTRAFLFNALQDVCLFSDDDNILLDSCAETELRNCLSESVSTRLFPKTDEQTGESSLKIHKIEEKLEKLLVNVVELLGCKTPTEAVEFLRDVMSFNSSARSILSDLNKQEIDLHKKLNNARNEMGPKLIEMSDNVDALKNSVELDCQLALKRSEALQLRSELLKCEVLAELYSEPKVQALQKISEQLEKEISSKELELERLSKTLAQYKVLGPDFHEVVREFRQTKKQIESSEYVLYDLNDSLGS